MRRDNFRPETWQHVFHRPHQRQCTAHDQPVKHRPTRRNDERVVKHRNSGISELPLVIILRCKKIDGKQPFFEAVFNLIIDL
ncbi:MAG: hypothetical protein AAFR75_09535, partial [Pseudomonadota bacterium]